MDNEQLKNLIQKDAGIHFEESRSLTKFSTMKAISEGSLFHVDNINSLEKLVNVLDSNNFSYRVIGWGANFVLPEKPDYFLIKLNFPFDKNIFNDESADTWLLPASVGVNQLTSMAMKHGLKGWECLTGVPASLGGAIYMNAGTSFGEISDLVTKVWVLSPGKGVREVTVDNQSFSYRKNHFVKNKEIIIQAELKCFGRDDSINEKIKTYMKLRQDTQPLKEKTCGCMFKNYKDESSICPAGQFLDIMGLKGLSMGGYRISPKHANFLENHSDGTHKSLVEIMSHITKELNNQYGITFEQEIQV